MKSAGKARSNGLYRHIRTSKEIIRNLLNDLHKNSTRPSKNARSLGWNILFHSEKIPMPDQMPGFSYQKLLIPFSRHQFFQDSVTSLHIVQRCMNHICIFLRLLRIRKFITIIIPGINDIQKIILVKPHVEQRFFIYSYPLN